MLILDVVSFTTYSTFAMDTVQLVEAGKFGLASTCVKVTIAVINTILSRLCHALNDLPNFKNVISMN